MKKILIIIATIIAIIIGLYFAVYYRQPLCFIPVGAAVIVLIYLIFKE